MKFPTRRTTTPRATAAFIRKLADRIERGTVLLCAIESGPVGDSYLSPDGYMICDSKAQRMTISLMIPVRVPRRRKAK